MDRVGRGKTPLVIPLSTTTGKVLMVRSVVLREGPDDGIPCGGLRRVHRLEETAADDLEALLRRGGSPARLHPSEGVLQTDEGFLARLASRLDVGVGDRGDE